MNRKRTPRKLALNRDTVRRLDELELGQAAGGGSEGVCPIIIVRPITVSNQGRGCIPGTLLCQSVFCGPSVFCGGGY
jgi:hypothetical protein